MNLRNIDGSEVKIISNGSHKIIMFDCDTCGTTVEQSYRNYLNQKDGKFCRSCRNKHTANRIDVKEKQSQYTKNMWSEKMSGIIKKEQKIDKRKIKKVDHNKDTSFKNDNDIKNVNLIKDFLNKEGIKFIYESVPGDDTQCIFNVIGINDKKIEIRYINTFTHKMDYKKRFGIEGLPHDYFINISHTNANNEIRTIWIKDFEIDEKTTIKGMEGEEIKDYHRKWEVIKSYIRTATGHIRNRIYARDCEIKIVPNSQLRPFLQLNCFYGYRAANKNLGLYLKKDKCGFKKGTLLFVYTFGCAFYDRNKPGQLEVIRVATTLNTQVIGGASKCIKYFMENFDVLTIGKNDVEVKSLLFYVDADHNSSQSLETLGFDFISWQGNGFMNVDVETGDVFHRRPMEHKKIMQKMKEGKIYSIANAGTIVYKLEKEKWFNMRKKDV